MCGNCGSGGNWASLETLPSVGTLVRVLTHENTMAEAVYTALGFEVAGVSLDLESIAGWRVRTE